MFLPRQQVLSVPLTCSLKVAGGLVKPVRMNRNGPTCEMRKRKIEGQGQEEDDEEDDKEAENDRRPAGMRIENAIRLPV